MHLWMHYKIVRMNLPRYRFTILATVVLLLLLPSGGCRRTLPESMVAWQQSLSELGSTARRKHIEAARCDVCTRRALEEKNPAAASLFRAIARSERIHERNCLKAIRRLGGRYTPPSPITIPVSTTEKNIQAAIEVRRQQLAAAHRSISHTFDENNRYAGRLLIHIAGGDSHQLILLERCQSSPEAPGRIRTGYAVCPLCGNIYTSEYCDPYCPFCLTDSRDFLYFN